MLAEDLILDPKVVEIAKMVAQSVIIKQWHDEGLIACNPEYLTKAVEETWPDYLFCTGTMVQVVKDAMSNFTTFLDLSTHCQQEATKYLNSLPITDW